MGTTSPSEKVTDEDLSKASSQAAAEIGASAVIDILEQFGVGKLNELPVERRGEFLDLLRAAREAE